MRRKLSRASDREATQQRSESSQTEEACWPSLFAIFLRLQGFLESWWTREDSNPPASSLRTREINSSDAVLPPLASHEGALKWSTWSTDGDLGGRGQRLFLHRGGPATVGEGKPGHVLLV